MVKNNNKLKASVRIALLGLCVAVSNCSSLPDADALLDRHTSQQASFQSAFGPASERANAAIMARLKAQTGDIDILDKHIAAEEAISGNPLILGNKATLLQDGPETYDAMFAAIRAAKDHINMETYIFADDPVGQRFADLLIERQQAGVQVNIIYDSVGCIKTPKEFFERLKQAGIRVLEFNPINPLEAKKGWELNSRDHRKLLIIDGRTVFLGGINISDEYSSSSSSGSGSFFVGSSGAKKDEDSLGPWRDTDLQVGGPIVAEMQKLFMDTWQKQKGEPLPERDYFPKLDAVGNEIMRSIASTPDDEFSQIYLTLISAIKNAEKQIYLTNAYFVPDDQFMKALLEAARRGVDVQMILPSHTDSSLVFHAGRAHYTSLLDAGIKIFERKDAMLHAKTAVIDGVWSTVGSSNLDWRSFSDNDEVNAIVLGRDFATRMLDEFDHDRKESRVIDAQRWKRRSPMLRLKERFSVMWERLL